VSRGQEDFDNALRNALEIRGAYFDLLGMIEEWPHLRFDNAGAHFDKAAMLIETASTAIDAAVGACVSEHFSRLPEKDAT
jgi:hypothetical protein